jgi:hypothetical protein
MWKAVKDKKGQQWLIDWEQFNNIIVAYANIHAFAEAASIKPEAIPWGRDIDVVDFDHKAMREHQRKLINSLVSELVLGMASDGTVVFQRLCRLRSATIALREKRAELFRQTGASANKSIAVSDLAVSLATLTRDVAITCIAVVAVPAGGAVALGGVALTGAGTALAKYQDTGNANAALIAGTGSLIVAGAGACANMVMKADKVAKGIFIVGGVFVDTSFEFVGAKAEGKSDSDSFKAAFLKGVFSSLGMAADAYAPVAEKFDDAMKNVSALATSLTRMQLAAIAGKGSLEAAKKAIEIAGNKAADAKSKATSKAQSYYTMPEGNFVKGYVLAAF